MHRSVGICRYRDKGRYLIMYKAESMVSRAIRICYIMEPYLTIPDKKTRARQVITLYKNRPMIRV